MRKGKDSEPYLDPDQYLWLMEPEAQKHADPVPDPDPQHWLFCGQYQVKAWPGRISLLFLLNPVRTAAASSSPEAEPAVKKTRRQISRAIFGDSSQDEEEGEEEEMEQTEQTDSVQILDTEPLQKVISFQFIWQTVSQIRDVYSGSEFFPSPIRIKEFSILTPKKGF